MQTGTPDSSDPKFRLKVGVTCVVLSALIGALHGQMVSEAQARRADPTRAAHRGTLAAASAAPSPIGANADMAQYDAYRQ